MENQIRLTYNPLTLTIVPAIGSVSTLTSRSSPYKSMRLNLSTCGSAN